MSLFRQQALEQRRLPDPLYTSVAIVAMTRWLWIAAVGSLLMMGVLWMLFAKTVTVFETSATIDGMQSTLVMPPNIGMADGTPPWRVLAHCPQPIEGVLTMTTPQTYILHLDQAVHSDCHLTVILHEERLFERVLR